MSGEGLFKGRQTNLAYVPEQHTDFIFTVVGEELGFVGGATLIGLYGLLVWRVWRTARCLPTSSARCSRSVCSAIFAFQIFENIGMTMGIMPITGIPLPFMSYGGSAIIASLHRDRPRRQRQHEPLQLDARAWAPRCCPHSGAAKLLGDV